MAPALRQAMVVACLAFLVALLAETMPGGSGAWAQQAPPPSLRPPAGAGDVPGGVSGNRSDSEIWRQIRHGAEGRVSIPDAQAATLVQSQGELFRLIKTGPLLRISAWALAAIVVLLAAFYLLRGRIRVEAGLTNRTVERFNFVERFAHWLTAGPFIVLALTGLNMMYGKQILLPLIGPTAFAQLTLMGKYAHDFLGFAFIAGVLLMIVLWVRHNIPNRHDLRWLAVGGGLFAKGVHPPAKKFNAGQKLIFWVVVILGLSLGATGIALLFPFQVSLFAGTFKLLNVFGLDLPTVLTPLQETQLALLWHAIIAIAAIVVIIAHIYIGSLGMEGAIDAVTSGQVDEAWAHEHHSLWLEEIRDSAPERPATTPAE